MKRSPRPITTPALKYGPTVLYGRCEASECEVPARATCSVCGGQFCRGHLAEELHSAETTKEQ
jgi:hypothetical protein